MKAHHRAPKAIKDKEDELKLRQNFQQIRDAHPDMNEDQAMKLAKRQADAQARIDNPFGPRKFQGEDPNKKPQGLDAMRDRNKIPWEQLHPAKDPLRGLQPKTPHQKADTEGKHGADIVGQLKDIKAALLDK